MKIRDYIPVLISLSGSMFLGYIAGSGCEHARQWEAREAHEEKLKQDLMAPLDGGACPTYEQVTQRHYCQTFLKECYPLVDGGKEP